MLTLGFIYSPTRDISATVDYFRIKRKDQIDRFSAAYLLAREAQFPNAIVRDPNQATWLPGVPNSGPIFAVLRQFFNLASTEVTVQGRFRSSAVARVRAAGSSR